MGSDLQKLRAPPAIKLEGNEYVVDCKERAQAIIQHQMLYPEERYLHTMKNWPSIMRVAKTLTDADGLKVMPVDDTAAEFEKYLKEALSDYLEEVRFFAKPYVNDGERMVAHRVARYVLSMAQADDANGTNPKPMATIQCKACLDGVDGKPKNRKQHVAANGCLYKRTAAIIDKYVEKAYLWVVHSDPYYYIREVTYEKNEWENIQHILYADWDRYVPTIKNSIPLSCPVCQPPHPRDEIDYDESFA